MRNLKIRTRLRILVVFMLVLIALLRADGQLWKPRVWWQGLRYFFGRDPGVFWSTLGPWLAFFRRDFHPWKDDDRALIRSASELLALRT